MIKKQLTYIIPLAIVAALAIPKIWCGSNKQQISKPTSANMPVNVTVYVANTTMASTKINVSGTLQAAKEVVLYSEIQGTVSKIYFQEGNMVNKNQLLLELNMKDIEAQMQKLKAQKNLKQLIFERNKILLSKGGISEEEFNISETELKVAEAEILTTDAQLAKAKITAPFSGRIGISNIYEGSMITPSTPITSLHQTNKLKLEFSVPEKYSAFITNGQKVMFQTASTGNTVHQAVIYAFEPKVDELTRNILVRAWFENTPQLKPGSFANVELPITRKEQIINIPTQCVVPGLKTQKVYVVKKDSVSEKEIETGFRWSDKIEVLKGIEVGDSVVVAGIMYMRNKAKVNVTDVVNKQ